MGLITITSRPVNLGKFQKALGKETKRIVMEVTREWGAQMVRELRYRTDILGAVHKRRLLRGWVAQRQTPTRMRVFNRAKHTVFVENGRRKGAKMPPEAPILRWVREKGMVGSSSRRRSKKTGKFLKGTVRQQEKAIAFLIRRSISRKGIKAKRILSDRKFRSKMTSKLRDMLRDELQKAMKRAANG